MLGRDGRGFQGIHVKNHPETESVCSQKLSALQAVQTKFKRNFSERQTARRKQTLISSKHTSALEEDRLYTQQAFLHRARVESNDGIRPANASQTLVIVIHHANPWSIIV